jgi:cytidine deaminase
MLKNEIFDLLCKTRDQALAEYSDFKVGAVIISKSGEIYYGHNIESSSYGLTICAERVALFKALTEGEREFDKIYILANNNEFCPPCGACRQLLMDYSPKIEVVLVTNDKRTKVYKLNKLLPDAFTPNRILSSKKK